MDCQRGKERKPKASTEPAHVGGTHIGKLTCCRDEFWKHIPAGEWLPPEDVGTQGSLMTSRASAPDTGLLRWMELSTEHPNRRSLSRHGQPFAGVVRFSSVLTPWAHPPAPLQINTALFSTKSWGFADTNYYI